MNLPGEEVVRCRGFYDPSEIHHRDSVRDVPHDGNIVRDEQVSEPQLLLQVLQQVDDLSLHRHVESRNGLVADEIIRFQRERACNSDALTLTSRELVRKALCGCAQLAEARTSVVSGKSV